MSLRDFEARYRSDPDPWGYLHSRYERQKYAATLAACGPGRFRCALELGASIGVFSALLAPRCRELVTIDFAPSAVASAKARLVPHPQVTALIGALPAALPVGRYDLVVASEVLYYLSEDELAETLSGLRDSMPRGGRLVAAHWLPSGPDRPLDARRVHDLLGEQSWLVRLGELSTTDYLLDVMRRT